MSTANNFIRGADFILAVARMSFPQGVGAVAENKMADLSMDFAVQVLQLTETIKGHYSLVNQLERSAASVGADIREGRCAQQAGFYCQAANCFEGIL